MVKSVLYFVLLFILGGCVNAPDGIKPASNFEIDKYLGKWYEIARLDHSFERGLNNVTAEYRKNDDGSIVVINRGYDTEKQEWSQANGKAKFVQGTDVGFLKVSFFGPFYGSYIIFDLDQENYQYAFVSGPNTSYLWLLSRSPTIAQDVQQRFMSKAKALGFNIEELIFVEHDKSSSQTNN